MRKYSTAVRLAGICILVLSASTAVAGSSQVIHFNDLPAGKTPAGFAIERTGNGAPAVWVVDHRSGSDPDSGVLVQRSNDPTNYRFPICIYSDVTAADVYLSVRFRPVSGVVDQAAGLVWRYQDVNNYYVVRANALEDNVVLYKVKNGKRSDLKPVGARFFSYGKDAEVPTGQWSTLGIKASGHKFEVYLNGRHLFDVEDDTFTGAGRTGLWTKADSVTEFDDLTVTIIE